MRLKKEIIVWRFLDGKIGHEKQSLALVNSLNLEIKLLNIPITNLIITTFINIKKLAKLSRPDLIIGVGHRVHLSVLVAKFLFGGKSIVIMKPSIPVHWFDLCIIPKHDQYNGKGLVYRTNGALCDIKNRGQKKSNKGLILIGGLSKDFIWNKDSVLKQIMQLVTNNPNIKFELTTSRRTPIDFSLDLEILKTNHDNLSLNYKENLKISFPKNQNKNWIQERMSEAKFAWITEDSISMISESLTAGQLVGIIKLSKNKLHKKNKKINSLDILKKEGFIFYDQDGTYKNTNKLKIFPNQAEKCANWIKQNFISNNQLKKNKKNG